MTEKPFVNQTLIRLIIFGVCIFVNSARAQDHTATSKSDDDIVTGSIPQGSSPILPNESQNRKPPEFGHCYHFNSMGFYAPEWIEKDLQNATWPNPVEIDGETIDRSEWIAIDACARTSMAEIGSERACKTDGYNDYAVALARIIANRANYTLIHANDEPDPIDAYLNPTKTAVEDKHQFSVWNSGAKVVEGAPCPTKNGPNASTWNEYLSLCKISVLENGKRIKVRTTSMNDTMLFYTSGCKMHYQRLCQHYSPLEAEISSTKINDYRCFEMWKDNHVHLDPDQESTCSAKAEACCTSLKKGDHVLPEMKASCDANATKWAPPRPPKKKTVSNKPTPKY
jgi:hypothetical protein